MLIAMAIGIRTMVRVSKRPQLMTLPPRTVPARSSTRGVPATGVTVARRSPRLHPFPRDQPAVIDLDAPVHDDREPCLGGDPSGLGAHDAELKPETRGSDGNCLVRVRRAELGASEHVDNVDRSARGNRILERRVALEPLDLALVGVDGDDVVPDRPEVAEDVVGGSMGLGRGADYRDPPAGPKDLGDSLVIRHRDLEAPLAKVDHLANSLELALLAQVAPSRW